MISKLTKTSNQMDFVTSYKLKAFLLTQLTAQFQTAIELYTYIIA